MDLEAKTSKKTNASRSETFHKITSLGLTTEEALGWYRNHVQSNWLLRSTAASLSGITLVLISTAADVFLQRSLMMILLQCSIFASVGILFAYALHSTVLSGLSVRVTVKYETILQRLSILNQGVPFFLTAALLTCYWWLPSSLSMVSLNNLLQIMMYLTFVSVGVLVFAGSLFLPIHGLTILSIIIGKMLGLFGAILILSPKHLYAAYPAAQQTATGVVLITLMVLVDMTVMPYWLYRYFNNADRIRQT